MQTFLQNRMANRKNDANVCLSKFRNIMGRVSPQQKKCSWTKKNLRIFRLMRCLGGPFTHTDPHVRYDRMSKAKSPIHWTPWAPQTMKNRGFGHLTTRLFTIKTSRNVGFGGPWQLNSWFSTLNPEYETASFRMLWMERLWRLGRAPKGNDRIQTIHFQVQTGSFREVFSNWKSLGLVVVACFFLPQMFLATNKIMEFSWSGELIKNTTPFLRKTEWI